MKGNRTENKTLLASLIIVGGIISLFTFLHPTLLSDTFAFQRQNKWNSFAKVIQDEKNFSAQDYWRFREFYSLGNFEFNEKGFSDLEIRTVLQRIDIPVTQSSLTHPFLLYSSDHFKSIDSMTDSASLSAILNEEEIEKHAVIINTDQLKIYKTDTKTIKLIFIKPVWEMQRANGFFDYSKMDPEILEGKYWLNISSISL